MSDTDQTTISEPSTVEQTTADELGVRTPKSQAHLIELPESLGYRIKNKLLGPPLHSERIEHERLGNPTALAVFASDNLSSAAYATEEILRVLIPVIGIFAFSMVVPTTFAMLLVLALLILSYRQTIKAYPKASGAYIVTKDNFGTVVAQVAGVSLLTDYVLTVAVSTAAGAAALASAFEVFEPFVLYIAIFFVFIIGSGNLKGLKESGRVFAVPTYFFIANMGLLLSIGIFKAVSGSLEPQNINALHDTVTIGTEGIEGAMFFGGSLFLVLHAFASGGAAVTGVEAISDGVPAFREPAWKNARKTLAIMGCLLAVMFLGLSLLASKVHAIPYLHGTPTVIAQVGQLVYGDGSLGMILFYSLQAGTMLILVLAANTGFADFPRLANFQAGDSFMPRQLTKRGHRLVYSNGIIFLAVAAIVVLVATGAKIEHLIPLYAVGVFTSFTLSQSGMARFHLRHKHDGWRRGLAINGFGAFVSFVVLIVFATTKFKDGAWAILIIIPVFVIPLFRLNKQYEIERAELESGAPAEAAQAKILDRHVVLVLVHQLDMAAARAIQYARTLVPDELMAVHFDLDPIRTAELTESWSALGFSRLPLEVIECPDRRIERATAELAARYLVDGHTEVTVLMPRREYSRFWHRLLHDHTADDIADVLANMPHCNVTFVPFHIGSRSARVPRMVVGPPREGSDYGSRRARGRQKDQPVADHEFNDLPPTRLLIADAKFRERVVLAGKVHAMRVQPWSGTPAVELTLVDETGAMNVVFFGRRSIAGVKTGTRLIVEGVVGEHRGKTAMLNPSYEIKVDPHPPA